MHNRIKEVRKSAGLTQQEFADRLGISRSNIGNYESGSRVPIDAAVKLICEKFHINEAWLRSGVGEMKSDMTLQQELALIFADVLNAAPDKKSAFLAALAAQPPEFFEQVCQVCVDTVERMKPLWEHEKEGQPEGQPPDGQ